MDKDPTGIDEWACCIILQSKGKQQMIRTIKMAPVSDARVVQITTRIGLNVEIFQPHCLGHYTKYETNVRCKILQIMQLTCH